VVVHRLRYVDAVEAVSLLRGGDASAAGFETFRFGAAGPEGRVRGI
jgi:hypothetical protein